jgi:hypothetical protein
MTAATVYARLSRLSINRLPCIGSDFDCLCGTMSTGDQAPDPRTPPSDEERDRKDDDTPETPPTEPPPVPVKEPPDDPNQRGPFVVR